METPSSEGLHLWCISSREGVLVGQTCPLIDVGLHRVVRSSHDELAGLPASLLVVDRSTARSDVPADHALQPNASNRPTQNSEHVTHLS